MDNILFLLILCYAALAKPSSLGCKVSIDIIPTGVYEGDNNVTISCISTGICVQEMFWAKDFEGKYFDVYRHDSEFIWIPQYDYTLEKRALGFRKNFTTLQLVIHDTRETDSGKWICRNTNGTVSSGRELYVTKWIPPCSVFIDVNPTEGYEGNILAITCISSGICETQTYWMKSFHDEMHNVYKYDVGFHPIAHYVYTLEKRAYGIRTTDTFVQLFINDSKIVDSGRWVCRNGNYTSEEIIIVINEWVPPCTVSIDVNPTEGYEGNTLAITCISSGICEPQTYWMKSFHDKMHHVYKYDVGFHAIARNEYTLEERAYGMRTTDTFVQLFINDSKIVDNGRWVCRNGNYNSQEISIIIIAQILKENITIHRENPTIIGLEQTYICTSTSMHFRYDVKWQINGRASQDGDDSGSKENEDGTWSIHSTLTETLVHVDETKLSCSLTHPGVEDTTTESDTIDIKYMAAFEYLNTTVNGTIDVKDELRMSCVASGSDPEISWRLNGKQLEGGFYVTTDAIGGNFSYGQREASLSHMIWTMDEQMVTCANINRYNGIYQCVSVVEIGDIKTESSSDSVCISVLHPPIVHNQPRIEIIAALGQNITLACVSDCSNPPVNMTIWNSTNSHEGLDKFVNKSVAFIIVNEEDYGDTIICTLSNHLGNTEIFYIFKQAISNPPITTAESLPSTSLPYIPATEQHQKEHGNEETLLTGIGIGIAIGIVICALLVTGIVAYRRVCTVKGTAKGTSEQNCKISIDNNEDTQNEHIYQANSKIDNISQYDNNNKPGTTTYEQLTFERQKQVACEPYEHLSNR